MICQNAKCKKDVPEDSKFCPYCATQVKPASNGQGMNFGGMVAGAGIGAGAAILADTLMSKSAGATEVIPNTPVLEDASSILAMDYGIDDGNMDALNAFANLTGATDLGDANALADSLTDVGLTDMVDTEGVADSMGNIMDDLLGFL